jgi:hypothetical protein
VPDGELSQLDVSGQLDQHVDDVIAMGAIELRA